MQTSKRLEGIGEYYFSAKLREIDDLNKAGKRIINLGIGSPDLPPHPEVIRVLQEESAKAGTHGYQNYKGSLVLRKAISDFYQKWYDVTLNPESDILPLMGSKEGIVHICMTYLDQGDKALVPNPGYPTYRSAVTLAGGESIPYELTEENQWEPDLEALQNTDLGKVKLMWVNFPHMPTGRLPSMELFRKLVAFSKRNSILICHDNPYSFILNEHPMSLLSAEGAIDVAIELNSLSKSGNMAGWRVGYMAGCKEHIDQVLRFKSNMDSGMFLPVQLAAAKALSQGEEWYRELNSIYSERREIVFDMLKYLKCTFTKDQAGLFIWAKIPPEFTDGYKLSDHILHSKNVFITPGGIFGTQGMGYIRTSLCQKSEVLYEALDRIAGTKE